MVLYPAAFRCSRSLGKRLRRGDFRVTTDTAFDDVIQACAEPRPGQAGTWIVPAMQEAYRRLFDLGIAHSIETWSGDHLVGGLYGVAIGRAFFGESMFSRASDASKVALAHLCAQLQRWEFGLIDCQMETAHLRSLGAAPIPRRAFLDQLAGLVDREPLAGPWLFDPDLFG